MTVTTVTIEVEKPGMLNLLRDMESLGLIRMQYPASQDTSLQSAETVAEDAPPYRWGRGRHKGIPGASVEDFLADCRADKERELAIEKREEEERARARAKKLHS